VSPWRRIRLGTFTKTISTTIPPKTIYETCQWSMAFQTGDYSELPAMSSGMGIGVAGKRGFGVRRRTKG
jgi:hypothetical protein